MQHIDTQALADAANARAAILSPIHAALARAQAAVQTVHRDGKNQHQGYAYATADQIAEVARTALSAQGLAWYREVTEPATAVLEKAEIGKQSYVGDVVIKWVLAHEGGQEIRGQARYPVIVGHGRPHEKATAASITYGTGQILMGLLCLDREDEATAVDRRREEAEEARRPKPKPAAKPADAGQEGQPKANPLAGLRDATRRRVKMLADANGSSVPDQWSTVCRTAAVPVQRVDDCSPDQLVAIRTILRDALAPHAERVPEIAAELGGGQ